jgi:hypothetical protein
MPRNISRPRKRNSVTCSRRGNYVPIPAHPRHKIMRHQEAFGDREVQHRNQPSECQPLTNFERALRFFVGRYCKAARARAL